jgi:hypothetical protein
MAKNLMTKASYNPGQIPIGGERAWGLVLISGVRVGDSAM